jgi:HEAT repeat protein
MNRKYLSYVLFFALVAIVIGIAVNHNRYIRSQINAMCGNNQSAAIAAAKELVETDQFSDTISGEPKNTRVRVIQALEDWASQPAPPPAPAPAASTDQTNAPKVYTPADAVTTIITFLKDQEKVVRDRATVGLIRVCTKSDANISAVITGMEDADLNTHKACVLCLQFMGQSNVNATMPYMHPEYVDVLKSIHAINQNATPMDAATYLFNLRDPAVASDIIPKVVAAIKSDTTARSPGGDVLSAFADHREECSADLIPLLQSSDDDLKAGVADALGKIGSKTAIPALLPLLKQSAEVRKAAIGGIALIADISGETPLIDALIHTHDDDEAREQAAVGLGKIATPEAIDALITALSDLDIRIQDAAVSGLARAGIPAIGKLDNLMKSPQVELRFRAAQTLARISLPESNATLIRALADKDNQVAREAVQALGFQGNVGAVAPLVASLGQPRLGADAANALARIGDAARPALIHTLGSGNSIAAFFAAQSLSAQGAYAVPALQKEAETVPQARTWTAYALGQIGGDSAATALDGMKKYGDPELQRVITVALSRIGASN